MSKSFTREQVLEAIEGSGAIISTIATRLSCAWDTARTYVNRWASTKAAFKAEGETFLDDCETLLRNNIKLAKNKQEEDSVIVDTSDAKWVLARLGKDRGYTERTETEISGEVGVFDQEAWAKQRAARHAAALTEMGDYEGAG
jgi:hypothetical protein